MSTSLVLRTAGRLLVPLLLLLSVFLLLRGHHEPGGGFIGGLVAAAAFALYAIAADVPAVRSLLRVSPRQIIGVGLLVAALSGVVALVEGLPFLTARWFVIHLPGVGDVDIGTALFFDIGVFLVVVGIMMLIILTLAEE